MGRREPIRHRKGSSKKPLDEPHRDDFKVEFDPDLLRAFVEALARDAARRDFAQAQRACKTLTEADSVIPGRLPFGRKRRRNSVKG